MALATHTDDSQSTWLAPHPLARERVLERAGATDRATKVAGAVTTLVLLLTAIFSDAWALLPLAVLLTGIAIGPIAVKRGAHPEVAAFTVGICIGIAMAAGAGATGDFSSPLAYLLPVGVVMTALRGVPASIMVSSIATAAVFAITSLLADADMVVDEPLPMIAILAALIAVTVASITLASAEIGYRQASIIDPLTGLLNRQALEGRFEELRQQARVSAAPLALILFDLDDFKQINDRYGHDVGDELLREIAYEVRKSLRRFELAYRIGGEEFLVVLPGMAIEESLKTAEELRGAVGRVRLGNEVGVTASFGVSGAAGERVDFEALYRGADQALYRAKRGGRDRVRANEQTTA